MKEESSFEDSNDEINKSNENVKQELTGLPDKKEKDEKSIQENNVEIKDTENRTSSKVINNDNENSEDLTNCLLSKKDFMTTSNKKNFCETRYIKRIVVILIYILSYVVNAIFIRINSLDLLPVKASFIQGAILSIFIPISFFISSNRNFKKNKRYIGKEKEVLNIEIENNMKEGISDFMNKKYYEVYYHYISKFYFITAFLSLLYFLSIFLFYQGISYTQPLFGQLFFPFISIILVVFKLFDKNFNCSLNKVLSILCILIASSLYMISFIKNNDIKSDQKNYIYSSIFLGICILCLSTFIYVAKKVFKKYFYYVDVLEFAGYTGIYIAGIVPLVLIILYAIFYSELKNNNPSGGALFIVLGKAFFSTCVCDLALAYILKYFALKITCKIMVVNLSIIYLIFYFVTAGRNAIFKDYYFLSGQILNLIIVFLLFYDIYNKNIKREVYEVKKQRIRASL